MKRLIKMCNKIYLKDIIDPKLILNYGENTDYGIRSFAISYINGNLYIGDTHKDTLEEYLSDNEMNIELNHSEGFVTSEEQEDIDIPMGFASFIDGIDNNKYLVIYPDTLFNISLDQFVSKLRINYPNAIICLDENNRYLDSKNVYLKIY